MPFLVTLVDFFSPGVLEMPSKRQTKTGRLAPYIDVRDPKQVPKFESLLSMGPTLVLVYADWCGHCQRFKKEMWNDCATSENGGMNTAAVHYDMVDKTSMKSANIEGYPTLFEVKTPSSVPKAVPTPQTKEALETLIKTGNENMVRSEKVMTNSRVASQNTFIPSEPSSLPPETEEMVEPVAVQKGGAQTGGSLLHTLLKVVEESAHAALLASTAMELGRRMKKKKTRKSSSKSRHQTRRR